MRIVLNKNKVFDEQVNKDDKRICLFLSVLMVGLIITNFGDVLSEIMGGVVSAANFSFIAKALCGIFFLLCIPSIVKKFTKNKLIFIFLSLIVTVLNIAFFHHQQFIDTITTYYTMCLTGFLAADTINDYALLRKYLVITSRVVSFIIILVLLLSLTGRISALSNSGYRMGIGYSCIICIMILIWNAVQEKAIYDFIGAFGLLIMVFLYGSRGPLAGIIIFGVYFAVSYYHSKHEYLKCAIVVIAFLLLLVFYQDILNFVYTSLLHRGVTSRSIYLLTTNINYDSGRNKIWDILIQEISSNPFRIRGINADYSITGTYSHNLIIELLYEHGFVIGGVFLIIIAVKIINTLRLNISEDASVICLIYMFACIPSLMFSGSIWTTMNFWIWLAMIVSLKYSHRSNAY